MCDWLWVVCFDLVQIVNLHYMLSKAVVRSRPSVLWCYKDKLELSRLFPFFFFWVGKQKYYLILFGFVSMFFVQDRMQYDTLYTSIPILNVAAWLEYVYKPLSLACCLRAWHKKCTLKVTCLLELFFWK